MIDTTPLRTYDLSKIQTYAGFLQQLFRLQDAKRMTCLPAIVEKFDRQSNMALVKPLVKFVVNTNNGDVPIDRPPCTVPVFQTCRGGYMIDLPLFRGDTGLLIAMDRDSSSARAANSFRLWEEQNDKDKETVKNTGATPPDGFVYTSFEFGVFIPMAFGSSNLPFGINPVTRESMPEEGIVIKRMMNPTPNDELPSEKQVNDSRDIYIKMDNDGLLVKSSGGSIRLDKDGIHTNSDSSNVNISGSVVSVDVMTEEKVKANEERESKGEKLLPPSVVIDGESITVTSANEKGISNISIKPEQVDVITNDSTVVSITPTVIDMKIGEDSISMSKSGLKYTGKTTTDTETIMSDGRLTGTTISTLKFQKKTRNLIKFGDFVVGLSDESDWITTTKG